MSLVDVGCLLAQPGNGLVDAVAQIDASLPAEQSLGLLDRGPPALDVDLETRPRLELEVVRRIAAGLPDHAGNVRHRALLAGRDVEILVLAVRRGHRGNDPVGNVVDVRERAGLAP